MKPHIVYTGAFRFPDGDAAAFRVRSVAKLFATCGHRVTFAGWEGTSETGPSYIFDGHECFPQSEFRTKERGAVIRLIGFLLKGRRTLAWLLKNPHFDVVVAYNPPALFALALVVLGRVRRARVVLDSTEWYDSGHLPGGRFGLAAIENAARMRLAYPLFRHVICISTFLSEYFAGRTVVRIPPLIESMPPAVPKSDLTEGVFFVYAGEPGRKDSIVRFIAMLPAIESALGCPARMRIAGLDWTSLASMLVQAGANPIHIAPFVECHGRVSRERVGELYAKSHFSVLFRANKRYAKAGFPTKATESWSHGCPIIGNAVGDLGVIGEHGKDCIFVNEGDLELELPRVLSGIIASRTFGPMSASSRLKAERLFSLQHHQMAFAGFIDSLSLAR